MAKKKTDDLSWIHRQAGMAIQFEYQDNPHVYSFELDYTTILGQVPEQEVWIVECDLTVTDYAAQGEYWWPPEEYLAVYKQENGTPFSRHATDEEIALFVAESEGPDATR